MPEAPAPSPLGRYDDQLPGGDTREVRLLGVPVALFVATRQHHDELMREFAVMALAHRDEDSTLPADLRELIHELGAHYAPSSAKRTEDEIDVALAAGNVEVDFTYQVSSGVVAAADHLEALMARADEVCRQGRMLAMPRTPAMRRFADWWICELRRQVAGHPATPWPEFASFEDA